MSLPGWSLALAALGLLASGLVLHRVRARLPEPHGPWLLGLAALFPAWLLSFVAGLGYRVIGGPVEEGLPVPLVLSSAAGLVGVIVTEALVRRRAERGRPWPPLASWALGALALAPAWAIAFRLLLIPPPR